MAAPVLPLPCLCLDTCLGWTLFLVPGHLAETFGALVSAAFFASLSLQTCV